MQAISPQSAIREYIVENLLLGADVQFDNDESLLEAGVLDSTAVLEMIGFLGQFFSIRIEDNEIIPDNFETVNRMVAYLKRKTTLVPAE